MTRRAWRHHGSRHDELDVLDLFRGKGVQARHVRHQHVRNDVRDRARDPSSYRFHCRHNSPSVYLLGLDLSTS